MLLTARSEFVIKVRAGRLLRRFRLDEGSGAVEFKDQFKRNYLVTPKI
jgi:hypothetical protein